MPNEDQTTIDKRYKYLHSIQKKYKKTGRKGHSQLLDRMEEVTGLHCTSLIRLMNGSIVRKLHRKQRDKTYGARRGIASRS